jgi:hypothetical protein
MRFPWRNGIALHFRAVALRRVAHVHAHHRRVARHRCRHCVIRRLGFVRFVLATLANPTGEATESAELLRRQDGARLSVDDHLRVRFLSIRNDVDRVLGSAVRDIHLTGPDLSRHGAEGNHLRRIWRDHGAARGVEIGLDGDGSRRVHVDRATRGARRRVPLHRERVELVHWRYDRSAGGLTRILGHSDTALAARRVLCLRDRADQNERCHGAQHCSVHGITSVPRLCLSPPYCGRHRASQSACTDQLRRPKSRNFSKDVSVLLGLVRKA